MIHGWEAELGLFSQGTSICVALAKDRWVCSYRLTYKTLEPGGVLASPVFPSFLGFNSYSPWQGKMLDDDSGPMH